MAFKTLTRWYGVLFNNRVSARLRSDRHAALSKNHLLITMTGRKSGKRISIPVNYRRLADNKLVIGTEARWWLNLKGGADVEIELAGEKLACFAEPVIEDKAKREQLGRIICGRTWPLFAKSMVVVELSLGD